MLSTCQAMATWKQPLTIWVEFFALGASSSVCRVWSHTNWGWRLSIRTDGNGWRMEVMIWRLDVLCGKRDEVVVSSGIFYSLFFSRARKRRSRIWCRVQQESIKKKLSYTNTSELFVTPYNRKKLLWFLCLTIKIWYTVQKCSISLHELLASFFHCEMQLLPFYFLSELEW